MRIRQRGICTLCISLFSSTVSTAAGANDRLHSAGAASLQSGMKDSLNIAGSRNDEPCTGGYSRPDKQRCVDDDLMDHTLEPVTDTANNRFYDLRPLRRESGEDYIAKDDATGHVYKINVCAPVHSELWKVEDGAKVGIYTELSDGGFSLGQFHDQPHVSHDVLSLTYRDGSVCPADAPAKMESSIAFVCDHGVFGAGQPEFVSSLGDCHFFFVWKTQHACSTSSKSITSGVGVILTAILLLLAVYFAGFFLFNRFILKKTGREQLPPLGPTIIEAWSWAKDMAIITGVTVLDKVKSLMGRGQSGGFRGLPADEH